MLIVAGDLHLGQAANLGRLPDQQRSWELLCKVAVDQQADVIGTGDWFHSRRPNSAEIDAFQVGLRILREGGRSFLSIAGNHEVITRDDVCCLETACAGFDAHVFRSAEVVETEDGAIGFLPWTPGAGNARETAMALMVQAEALAEQGARVLIGHWALAAASLPSGLPILELAEPILDSYFLSQLFEITLCGHIHKRQVVVDEPVVAHVGPLVRGNFGEADVETGAWSINRIGHDGLEGSFIEAHPFEVPDRRFVTVHLDERDAVDITSEIRRDIEADAHLEGSIVRVRWEQRADQQVDQVVIIAALQAAGVYRVAGLEPTVERVQSTRSAGVSELTDPGESFDLWWEQQGETASREVLDTVRERAHERIGAAHA